MAGHNDGVNPLRPYYIPPSIGEPPEALPTPGPRAFAQSNSTGRYASKARDIFSDIDYKDYIAEPPPSVVSTIKEVLDELLWKYTSVLMAQPFEVAKTIMQVRAQDDVGGLAAAAEAAEEARLRQASQRLSMHDEVRAHSRHEDVPRTDRAPAYPLRLRVGRGRIGFLHLTSTPGTLPYA
jgi:fusion and transport protein UGO1